MGTDTKLIAHEGMGSGMWIFLKRGYGNGHYGTLPNGYPLPSLLVGIVSWFSQEDWLGLIKTSKEVNNLILTPKDLGVFLTVLEVEGGLFTGRRIEDLSKEFEGVHG